MAARVQATHRVKGTFACTVHFCLHPHSESLDPEKRGEPQAAVKGLFDLDIEARGPVAYL